MKTAMTLLLAVNALGLIVWFCSLRVRLVVGLPSGLPDRLHDIGGAWSSGVRATRGRFAAMWATRRKPQRAAVQDPELQRLNQAIRAVRARSGIAPAVMPTAARTILPDNEHPAEAVSEAILAASNPTPERMPSAGEARLIERMQRLRAAQNPAHGAA